MDLPTFKYWPQWDWSPRVLTMTLKHIEELAKEKGATLIRSDSGIENIASQKFHEKFEFKPYRIYYEKVL